jgi:hypothetical protein
MRPKNLNQFMHERYTYSVLPVGTFLQHVQRKSWTFCHNLFLGVFRVVAKSSFYCCYACLPSVRLPSFRPPVCPSVSPPVCLHVPAPLPFEGFPWNLMLGTYRKICPENPNFLAIRQKYGAVHDATITFLYCRRYELAIKTSLCNTRYFISLAVTFTSTMNKERN